MKTQIASNIQSSMASNNQSLYSQPSATSKAPAKNATPWSIATRTLTGEALTIRKAVAADAAALAAIGSKGFAAVHQMAVSHEEMNGALSSAWSESSLAELIATADIQTLVAETEKQIVGLVSLNPTYRPSYLRRPTPIELGRFYLHLDWIGCGVGSHLMTQALRQAAAAGYGLCWLRVWQGNKSAIHFYRRWGFTTISADFHALGNTMLPMWVMIHTLAAKEMGTMAQ